MCGGGEKTGCGNRRLAGERVVHIQEGEVKSGKGKGAEERAWRNSGKIREVKMTEWEEEREGGREAGREAERGREGYWKTFEKQGMNECFVC